MIHRSGGKHLARSTAVSIVLIVVAALSACTSGDLVVTETPVEVRTPMPTEQPVEAEAIITIASVDADGLNATVAGYVAGVEIDGAECEFILTPAVDTTPAVTVPAASASNVKTSSCGTRQVPLTQLSKGSWNVVLHFVSDELDIESAPTVMEVP